jgi:hypothetical protein
VSAALGAAQIPFAPVKGIVLARWIYADVAERPYVDIDLMVPRPAFAAAERVVAARGWPVRYHSREMGELVCTVDHVEVELHAEVGRPDLSRLTVEELLARARPDAQTFPFEILRVDDVDHFLLLVLNVIKDGFTYANPHQPADLERLLARLEPRTDLLLDRARAAGLFTALDHTAAWMIEEHHSAAFARLRSQLPAGRRRTLAALVRLQRRLARRAPVRLSSPGGLAGLALATLTPDDPGLRLRGLLRLVRRGAARGLGRDPDDLRGAP